MVLSGTNFGHMGFFFGHRIRVPASPKGCCRNRGIRSQSSLSVPVLIAAAPSERRSWFGAQQRSSMAPKAKRADARAKKACVKAKASPAKPAPRPHSGDDRTPNRKRTQLGRRDTDQQVERAMVEKLDHVPKSILSARRSKDGKTIREYIAVEIKRRRPNGGKVGCRCWTNLYQAFDLHESVAESLAEPTDESVPSAELLDVLAAAHHDNPVKACVTPLERFLDHSDSLGETATYGLLWAVQVAPTLPLHSAMKAQLAVLRFWARTYRAQHPPRSSSEESQSQALDFVIALRHRNSSSPSSGMCPTGFIAHRSCLPVLGPRSSPQKS